MIYKRLGNSGLKVSAICLGTMQFGWTADESTSFQLMDKSVELGGNFFDSADIYSNWYTGNVGGESETIIGNWMAKRSIRRSDIVIATKVRGAMGKGPNRQGLSRQHILNAVDASLKRLRTEYIDLYQMHYPDEETPLDETLQTLDDLIRWGKVRYVGCSNYPAWLLAKSLWISDVNGYCRFESLQPHYNYLHRAEFERELQPLCRDQNLGVLPYSPLAKGFLTGKYRRDKELPDSQRAQSIKSRYLNDRGFEAVEALQEVSGRHDASPAQTAISWLLANRLVSSVIIGANNLDQLTESFQSIELQLSEEDLSYLDRVTAWN